MSSAKEESKRRKITGWIHVGSSVMIIVVMDENDKRNKRADEKRLWKEHIKDQFNLLHTTFKPVFSPFFQLTFHCSNNNFFCLIFPLDVILTLISYLLRREFRFLLPFPWIDMTPPLMQVSSAFENWRIWKCFSVIYSSVINWKGKKWKEEGSSRE